MRDQFGDPRRTPDPSQVAYAVEGMEAGVAQPGGVSDVVRPGRRAQNLALTISSHGVPERPAGGSSMRMGIRPYMRGYVLVGGWPASGKTTLAKALAAELGLAYLSKDEVKEALMDSLGAPRTVERSRELGRAAVHAVLRTAQGCPGAVIDSTWFPYALPLVRALPGVVVEVRCLVDIDVARRRYRARNRDAGHLDALRPDRELWGEPVRPLGVGPLVEVDTAEAVDVQALAAALERTLREPGTCRDGEGRCSVDRRGRRQDGVERGLRAGDHGDV
ncbi:AAA family ATPase [Asanoa sp. NPDC050611]|uniref:AAA family ATPase n=1 Tax=Asanoa sp. NPDC050611 TaxID=3157098 RepID=UPI0033CCE219